MAAVVGGLYRNEFQIPYTKLQTISFIIGFLHLLQKRIHERNYMRCLFQLPLGNHGQKSGAQLTLVATTLRFVLLQQIENTEGLVFS